MLHRHLSRQGLDIHTGTRVSGADRQGDKITLHAEKDGQKVSFQGDRVLVSVGRRPCSAKLGLDAAGALVEHALADIAEALVAKGVRRLAVAGGETAGAVVTRLGVRSLRIGGEIDPGVPWTYAEGSGPGMLLALKSGNFGARDFFLKSFAMLERS